MSFGFVVDDKGSDKKSAGSPIQFAAALADGAVDVPAHIAHCPACQLGDGLVCVGVVLTPVSANGERWLVERLPEELESLPGFLLRKAIGDFGYDGKKAEELRKAGQLAAPEPFLRHYGPFYQRFVVSSEQILEELLCAGDIAPPHALAVLLHLGALKLDGKVPLSLNDDGPKMASLVTEPSERKNRLAFALTLPADADPSTTALYRLLRALYAGFVLDVDVYIRDSNDAS